MDIKPLENIYLALAFLVPGLIASFVRSQFITGRLPSQKEATLTYITLSVIYYALALPGIEVAVSMHASIYRKALAWFSIIFIGPGIFGFLLGLNAYLGFVRRILRRFHLNPVHVMPTAWDWKFTGMSEEWVLVVLKDGTQFAGFCGSDSFISSDPKERDLYIQKVYEIDALNEWHPTESGVLIAAGEIRTIEFWPAN